MECIEARALKKSSFLSEFAMNSSQQVMFDDFLYVNGISGVSTDDFSVDGFLDLSNDDFVHEEEESEEEKDSLSTSSSDRAEDEIYHSSGAGDSLSLPTDELAVPVDDLENLEWLSQFVDDSASELSLLCPADNCNEKTGYCSVNRIEPVIQTTTPVLCFRSPVPAKARTKRPRPSGRAWSGGSSSSTPSTSCENSPTSILIFSNQFQTDLAEEVVKPPAKKMKKRPAAEGGGNAGCPQTQRRCSHCQVQKTPQWRNGPLGPKTLCNACGVRFKSGRLFPEYRPACSPTFSGEFHSNSHRKVLEMRRKNEFTGAGDERVMNSASF